MTTTTAPTPTTPAATALARTPLQPSAHATRAPNARRRTLLRWTKRGGLGLVAAGVVGAIVYAWLPKPVAVDVAVVQRAALQVEIVEDGQTRVRERFVVAAPSSGDLQRIELTPGAVVHAGDVLLGIQPGPPPMLDARTRREATARVAGAKARHETAATAIARATAARDAAIREAARARTLATRGAIAIAELDRAELAEQLAIRDLAAARGARDAAAAEVDAAQAVIADAPLAPSSRARIDVVAPADGRVLRTLRESAGPVVAGTPLLELGDPSALEIVVDVLSSDAAQLAPAMPVIVERWGGATALEARIRQIEPSAFTRISALGVEEQRVRVIVALGATPASLGDGFRVSARIIPWRGDDVVVVPSSAVFRDHGAWAIYAIVDERAQLLPVTIGHRGRLDVELVSGATVGTRVIVHPGDSVHPGTRVVAR